MSNKGKIVVRAMVTGDSASGGPPIGPAVELGCKYEPILA